MKALVNAMLYDYESFHQNSYVLFDREIEAIGPMDEFPGADYVYDLSGSMVLPGLLNCHTHIYSAFSKGLNVPYNPKSLKDILDQLWWKLDGVLDGNAVYSSGLVYGIDCIKNGVTSIIDHHASGLIIKGSLELLKKAICDDLGLRGIFCFETSDRFDVEQCILENLDFGKQRTEKYAGMFGMHASMTLKDNTLNEISKKIGEMPVHIHVAEGIEDEECCRDEHGMDIVKRLYKFGLLNKDSLLSHCVHINENEAQLIALNNCVVALNPNSNMNNAVGLPDYKMFDKYKIKCVLGNDGLGANIARDCQSLVFSMHHNMKSPAMFGLNELRDVINNGYEYVGSLLNIKIGRIKKGYKADMIAVPYMPATPINEKNVLGHVFYGIFDGIHPKDVLVDGNFVMKDNSLFIDEQAVYRESEKEAAKAWARIK